MLQVLNGRVFMRMAIRRATITNFIAYVMVASLTVLAGPLLVGRTTRGDGGSRVVEKTGMVRLSEETTTRITTADADASLPRSVGLGTMCNALHVASTAAASRIRQEPSKITRRLQLMMTLGF